MNLILDDEETGLVTEILDAAYQDLRQEIYRTDAHEMRDALKRREAALARVLARLGLDKGDIGT